MSPPHQQSPCYCFAGGGTGGHLMPGFAVAEELQAIEPGCHIVFVGSVRPIERDLVTRHGFEHVSLPVEPSNLLRRNPIRFFRGNWRALASARRLLNERQPKAVIGLGGFASAPLVLQASRLKIPTLLLEQNTIPGRVTRCLSRRADRVCVSFEETRDGLPRSANVVVTGNPLQREIAGLSSSPFRGAKGDNHCILLILGGSQGSHDLNAAVTEMVRKSAEQLAGWQIVHQTGVDQQQLVHDAYAPLGLPFTAEAFFDDMASRYSMTTLAICRAGATTLAELACAGCPAVLVPFPHAADNHQLCNAQVFRDAGAALLVEQGSDAVQTATRLADAVRAILCEEGKLAAMSQAMRSLARPDAAQKVVAELNSLARGV